MNVSRDFEFRNIFRDSGNAASWACKTYSFHGLRYIDRVKRVYQEFVDCLLEAMEIDPKFFKRLPIPTRNSFR